MNEPNSDILQDTIDFLILSTLGQDPMTSTQLEEQIERKLQRYLGLGLDVLGDSLLRLQQLRWLTVESRATPMALSERIYSLTPAGRARLEAGRARQASALAQFVEEGHALTHSFGGEIGSRN
jgi:DNA-binding PadR family transcriptional regulator